MARKAPVDFNAPFQSARPETHEEWQARMGGEVLAVLRSELYLDFRFLDQALGALTPVPDERCGVLATDGRSLFYQPSALLRLYRENPKYLKRLYLHTIFHCVFGISGSRAAGTRCSGIWPVIWRWKTSSTAWGARVSCGRSPMCGAGPMRPSPRGAMWRRRLPPTAGF